ncbi:lysosomal alpha-glucosidase isoform X2 [Lingula anatina]|uniref:Lysosomal alpha-glucosidase isoform X2 n=1 Tax=Lingula anatina TaxID=7574 RepID=A0A2R2MQK9_LINAN|nr:lysosomal alpha-glucosidase isoform X2 [Lingula anatina]|eukprot:XP_023932526.1 lysosomal alpha-glucosidase isoform X2 [Lingula anatina]
MDMSNYTSVGGFIFADQFLQLSTLLPSRYVYGLGEHRATLLHSLNWTRVTLWNKDRPPVEHSNLYGSHPFYLVMEEDGRSHGVFLLNSNAMDVILQHAPAITWRAIGGILDFYIFTGPSPANVISQYTELIGRPFMPPYWSLGFHICRYGYKSVNQTLDVALRTHAAGIPQDVQWDDLDYSYGWMDFTYDAERFGDVPGLARTLHDMGMHYMMIFDPGLSNSQPIGSYLPYDYGMELDLFIKDNVTGKPLVGKVWPGTTVWVDWTHPKAQKYWTTLVTGFHNQVEFDGMWVDMNEPSNMVNGAVDGCPKNSSLENPPYVPAVHGGSLKFFTICPSSTQYTSSHYNLHNLYGLMMTKMSHNALLNARPNQRPFVISRSTYPGQGRYGGHWTGDNAATWHDLYASIPGILNFNLFGIPMVGADICGFRMNTTEPLCQRWYQLGAFYTFSRSHQERDTNSHDPTMFSKTLIDSTRKAYLLRYSLLPHLYTLFYNSHTRGETVLRPLFFEYPKDKNTYGIDQQFMWGKCFLISPVLSENTTEVQGYFPKGSWYDIQTGSQQKSNGQYVTIATPLDKINVHLREGCVIVTQTPNLTTTMSRKNKFGLVVALLDDGKSEGELYADDGKSADSIQKSKYNRILFSASKKDRQITSAVDHLGYHEDMVLGNLTIFNIGTKPSQLTVNGVLCNFTFSQNQVINVEGLTADLKKRLTVKWT